MIESPQTTKDGVPRYFLEYLLVITQPVFACSKLTVETVEEDVKYVLRQCRRSVVFIVILEHISHFLPVFVLLTLSR